MNLVFECIKDLFAIIGLIVVLGFAFFLYKPKGLPD